MTQIPFSPDLLYKGYKLIYRNGERPEDYKVWPDGKISTIDKEGYVLTHDKNGSFLEDGDMSIFDVCLTPPEMYVAVNPETNNVSGIVDDIKDLRSLYGNSLTYYRLVPVE